MIKKIYIALLLLNPYFNCIYARDVTIPYMSKKHNQESKKTFQKIICLSIPKCGTHLLKKCLALLDPTLKVSYKSNKALDDIVQSWIKKRTKESNIQPSDLNEYKGRYYIPSVGVLPHWLKMLVNNKSETVVQEHWPYTKESEDFFYKHAKAHFFIIRDPRDMIVSMAFFLRNGLDGEHAEVNDLIFDFIDGRKKHYIPWGVFINDGYPLLYEFGVTEFYKMYLPWMNASKFCAIKFENLVGPQGGGSEERQINEIKKIAQHLGIKATLKGNSEKNIVGLHDVAKNLFGQSTTFREGMIGGWKKHFTPEMKTAYKNAPGANQLLIDLGYEKDKDW